MENNNNVINDKVKGSLNVCMEVRSDNNVCNKNNLSSTIAEFDEEMKDNNIKSTTRLCHTCKDQFRILKAVSSKLSNPLSRICQKCHDKCNKEISKK